MSQKAIDDLQPRKLRAGGCVAQVEYHTSITSTQDRAHELARMPGKVALPLLIVAEEQTAGRGRGANRWWTGRGSLAFSLVFDPGDWDLPRAPRPERSLALGVAIIETLRPRLPARQVGLHWPNDVFVAGQKIAGILLDVLPDGRHIVGIGLNVNNRLDAAPPDVRARATSLCELTEQEFDRTELLLDLLGNIEHAVRAAAAAPEQFGQRFQELCLQVGQNLTVEVGTQRFSGQCAGIAPDGALLLETAHGWQRIYSGVLR